MDADVLQRAQLARVTLRWSSGDPWSEAEGRAVVDAWRPSGETAPAFARRHGLHTKRIEYWSERLSRAEREPPTLWLVPASVVAPDLVAVIRVGDVAIELERDAGAGRGDRPRAREVEAVILVPRAVRVYFATQPTNLRKSFDGLVNEIRHMLGYDPLRRPRLRVPEPARTR